MATPLKDVEAGADKTLALNGTFHTASVNSFGGMSGGGGMKKSLSKAFLSSGMAVTFKDVTYKVQNNMNKKETLTILNNVSGCLKPGEMAALMGPSGSEQFDTLLDILTVEEMMRYTADLKRPMSEPVAEKSAAVEEILELLALKTCRNVRIGSPLARGISGGQAKRVNIGIALITNPRILFLDEPTSGLDSYTSNEVMTVVKSLADHGITVCATIHSPTPYCFSLFDRLLLLLRGQVAYFGPCGAHAVDYFHKTVPNLAAFKEGEKRSGMDCGFNHASRSSRQSVRFC
ncbi:hypothetical protein Ndes2526B_g03891 [Nannochloris sp. 'desiccata']